MSVIRSIFRHILVTLVLIVAVCLPLSADVLPRNVIVQTGGGMGAVAIGAGWRYGVGHHWETDVVIGFVPRHDSGSARAVITVKENFNPWSVSLTGNLVLCPLTASIYFTTLTGSGVWRHQPDKYPDGYYRLPTRVRTHISVGQRLEWHFRKSAPVKTIAACYEFGTCDIYLLSAFGNSSVSLLDRLHLALALRCSF